MWATSHEKFKYTKKNAYLIYHFQIFYIGISYLLAVVTVKSNKVIPKLTRNSSKSEKKAPKTHACLVKIDGSIVV